MFRTRRQYRYEILRKSGFLPFEARELSKSPLKVPYFDILIKERYKFFQRALKESQSQQQYRSIIMKEYRDNGWIVRTRTGKIATKSAWNMYRAYEEIYRAKYPNYTSPWQKRMKDFRTFVGKVEKSVRGHYSEWLSQLDRSIAGAKTKEKRQQLMRQKANLETWLK